MSGTMIDRRPLWLDEDTVVSKHAVPNFRGLRKRSFGFHKPQKERPVKVQHPKPKKTDV